MRLVYLILAFAWLSGSGLIHAQSNLVLFISTPGDYIGQGQTFITTNSAEFGARFEYSPSRLLVTAFGYLMTFFSPDQSDLQVGIYPNGENIFGWGRGADSLCGDFQVLEIHSLPNGQLDRLWLTFTQYCNCTEPPLVGEIRYNSQLAPPAPESRLLRVPSDYSTIQAALDAANILAIDTVLVEPGVYVPPLTSAGT
jgi:hypothetical protein